MTNIDEFSMILNLFYPRLGPEPTGEPEPAKTTEAEATGEIKVKQLLRLRPNIFYYFLAKV